MLGNVREGIASWFRTRIDLGPAIALVRRKPVPIHRHSWIYCLGDTAVFLLALQVASGCLLMLYYQPTEATAHESVERIMTEVPYGWLIRSIHVWSKNFFIATVGLHFVTVLFARAYRRPRELTWISGVLLMFVVAASGFSGYLLPWNELSYYATLVGTQIPGTLPVVGDFLVHFLRGGDQLTGETLTRFFAAHVMLMPLAMGLLLAIHVLFTRIRGLSVPIGLAKRDVRDRRPFFGEFLLIEVCVWLLLFGVIVTLAVFFPAEIGVKADPLKSAPRGIRPEWYFLFLFQTLKVAPKTVGVALFAFAALFLLALPFLDRSTMRGKKGPGWTAVFVALLVYVVVFQVLAWISPGPERPHEQLTAATFSLPRALVSLGLLWAVIGFLIFYLRGLLRENTRVRRLYGEKAGDP